MGFSSWQETSSPMLSLKLDSITDEDALFGSGTDAWNNHPSSAASDLEACPLGPVQDITMTAHNTNSDVYEAEELPAQHVVRTSREHGSRPAAANGVARITLGAMAAPGNVPGTTHGIPSQITIEQPVVRPKEIKNKENRNKNAMSSITVTSRKTPDSNQIPDNNQHVYDGRDRGARSRFAHGRTRPFLDSAPALPASGWQPKLQVKNYDQTNTATQKNDQNKVVNTNKQKKEHANLNFALNQNGQGLNMSGGATSSTRSDIQFPEGLDPNSCPRAINHIYIKPNTVNSQSTLLQNDSNVGNGTQQTSVKVFENPNFTQFKNTWPKHVGDTISREPTTANQATGLNVIQNELEMDSDQAAPERSNNKTVLKLSIQKAASSSNLETSPIVVPYQQEPHLSDSSLNLRGSSLSQSSLNSTGSSPQNVVSTGPLSTVPTSSFLQAVISNDPLPSNLPSNFLFGDGNPSINQDYMLARQLQQQYDLEDDGHMQRNQFDIPSNGSLFARGISDEHNQCGQFNTLDFLPSDEFPTLNDSLTGDYHSVYNPDGPRNASSSTNTDQNRHTNLYIPIQCGAQTQHSGHQHLSERSRPNDPSVLTIPFENHVELETATVPGGQAVTSPSPEPIHIPLSPDVTESLPDPAPTCDFSTHSHDNATRSVFNRGQEGDRSRSNVVRGERSNSQEDAVYARRIQEQQDEEFARYLQEQEGESSDDNRFRRNNLRGDHHEARGGNLRSLRTRMDHQTLSGNRPLRVGPPSQAVDNNVADSRVRRGQSHDRPLRLGVRNQFGNRRSTGTNLYARLDQVRDVPENEGYDIPPASHDYYLRWNNEYDPDYMQDEVGEDRLISINRDPQLLASLLMYRAPNMMVPDNVDLNDYEALWELAENLGEVRRVGMEDGDVARLPVHQYTAPTSGADHKTDCLVCLCEFEAGDQLKTLPCCHIYHVSCIDEWLKRNAICPVCRQSAKLNTNR